MKWKVKVAESEDKYKNNRIPGIYINIPRHLGKVEGNNTGSGEVAGKNKGS